MAARFYVYAFDDESGCAYVGKGSGSRFKSQCRKLAPASGRIVERFKSEAAALRAERKLIAFHSPRLNRTAGGNGGRVRSRATTPAFVRRIEAIGSRRYAALLLLACHQAGAEVSKLERIRQVAHGRRV